MARFLFWSDLHDEFRDGLFEFPDISGEIDAVLIAGDLDTRGRHVDLCLLAWDRYRVPVVAVRGNHEFYGSVMPELIAEERARVTEMNAAGADIRILDGETTVIGDTRVIGATLWTDLELFPGHHDAAARAVSRGMNDFMRIQVEPMRHLKIPDWLEMHRRDRDAIFDHLDAPFEGPTLVMTHHMPLKELIHPLRSTGPIERQYMNAGFASDMVDEIAERDIDTWVCGHSHDNRRCDIDGAFGPIRFRTNARGYPQEGEGFDPEMILETRPRPAPEPA